MTEIGATDRIRGGHQRPWAGAGRHELEPSEAAGAFLYSDGQVHDLGDLGGGDTIAGNLNELGQVVGLSRNTDGIATRLFLQRRDGRMTDLTRWLQNSFNDVAPWTPIERCG